jgi:hypothetical protein
MFSRRFAIPVVVLFGLAAVPTVIHSYRDSTVADGKSVRAIPMKLDGVMGSVTTRRAGWGEERFSATDWTERHYKANKVRLFMGRSFDSKKLYHHPELAVDYGNDYEAGTVMHLPQRPDVPVHVMRGSGTDARRVALYALHYGDGFVADPIRFQLRTSLQLLFSKRKSMTLFFATQDLGSDEAPETSAAAAVLLAAMAEFEQQSVAGRVN